MWGIGGGGGRVAEKAFLSPRIRGEGDGERTVVVVATCCLLCGKESGEPPPSLQLMKFDIVEMTGAMTALCQDGGGKGGTLTC